mmetsp:Transcript_106791/g.340090  ORF Transcript_106791/g.340090 Transcript_106791/m.340090 type:complete len:249 (-) Transcript_106791:157-903(-)
MVAQESAQGPLAVHAPGGKECDLLILRPCSVHPPSQVAVIIRQRLLQEVSRTGSFIQGVLDHLQVGLLPNADPVPDPALGADRRQGARLVRDRDDHRAVEGPQGLTAERLVEGLRPLGIPIRERLVQHNDLRSLLKRDLDGRKIASAQAPTTSQCLRRQVDHSQSIVAPHLARTTPRLAQQNRHSCPARLADRGNAAREAQRNPGSLIRSARTRELRAPDLEDGPLVRLDTLKRSRRWPWPCQATTSG